MGENKLECKFCGGIDVRKLRKIKSPHAEVEYTLLECSICKQRFFRFSEHESSQEILQKLYDRLAQRNKKQFTVAFSPSRYWKNEVDIIKKLHSLPIKSVLDIGCRTGDFLMHWEGDIERVGVEASEYSSDIAERRGLKIYRDFVENVRFDHAFDVVSCYALLEHLEDPKKVMNTFTGLVRRGGMLVILIPAFNTSKQHKIWQNRDERWHMYSPPEHLNFYTKEWLTKYFANDFKLLDYKYTSGGMANPFEGIPVISHVGSKIMEYVDRIPQVNHRPIFDHLYLYFERI